MKDKILYLRTMPAVLLTLGALMMLMKTMYTAGTLMLLAGSIFSILNTSKKINFANKFANISGFLGLIILLFTNLYGYSQNLLTISTSFYALNFLIQINNMVKTKKKQKKINTKKAVKTTSTAKKTNTTKKTKTTSKKTSKKKTTKPKTTEQNN